VQLARFALEVHGDRGAWSEAFRAGYASVRPWPESDPATIAALRAARHLNILNFGLSNFGFSGDGPDRDAFITRHAEPVTDWMKT